MDQEAFRKVRRASLALRAIATAGMVIMILLAALLIAVPTALDAAALARYGDVSALGISWGQRVALWIVVLLSVAPTLWAMDRLRALFGTYAVGAALTLRAAETLLGLGRALFVMSLATVLSPTLSMLALTWHNPPGARQLVLQIGGATYALALAGGLIIIIGWVMSEAARQSSELREIV